MLVQLEKRGKTVGAMRVREQLYPQLLGSDHESLTPSLYAARWRAGFLREVLFAGSGVAGIEQLAKAPAARLMRALTISVPASMITEALAHATRLVHLRHLTVSSAHVTAPVVPVHVLARFTKLSHLGLRGAYVDGDVAGITSLLVAPTRHDVERLDDLAKHRFPDVTNLVLDLRNLPEPMSAARIAALRELAPRASFNVQR